MARFFGGSLSLVVWKVLPLKVRSTQGTRIEDAEDAGTFPLAEVIGILWEDV